MARNSKSNFFKNKDQDLDIDSNLLSLNDVQTPQLVDNAHVHITEDADDYFVQEPGFSNPVVIFDLKDYLDFDPDVEISFKQEFLEYYEYQTPFGTSSHILRINSDGTVQVNNPTTFDKYQEGELIMDNIEFTLFYGPNQTPLTLEIPLTVEGVNDAPFVLYDENHPTNIYPPIEFYTETTPNISQFIFRDDVRDVDNPSTDLLVDRDTLQVTVNGEIVDGFVKIGVENTSVAREYVIFDYSVIDQPAPGETYEVQITYQITDGIDNSETVVKNFTFTSPEGADDGINDAPIAVDDIDIVVREGEPLEYNILNNDYDVDYQDEISIHSFENLVVNGNAIDNSLISQFIIVDSEGNIFFGSELDGLVINTEEDYEISFDYTISDSSGAKSSAKVKITIEADDDFIDEPIDDNNDNDDNNPVEASIELEDAYFGDMNDDSNLIFDDGNEDPALNTNMVDNLVAEQGFVDIATFKVAGIESLSDLSAGIFTSDINIDLSNIELGSDFNLVFDQQSDDANFVTFRLYESGYDKIVGQLEAYSPKTFFVSVESYQNSSLQEALMEFDIFKNSFDNEPGNFNSGNDSDSNVINTGNSNNIIDNIESIELESFSFNNNKGYDEVENVDLLITMNQGRVSRPNFESSEEINQVDKGSLKIQVDSFDFEIDSDDLM